MINRVVLVGRLTRDPELRKANDKSVASFTLAVDNRGKTEDGKKTASFIPVTIWNEQADNLCKYTRKGSLVGVDGRLNQRSYQKKDGSGKTYVIEVIADSVQFLEPKGSNNTDEPNANEVTSQPSEEASKQEDKFNDVAPAEDDLPF